MLKSEKFVSSLGLTASYFKSGDSSSAASVNKPDEESGDYEAAELPRDTQIKRLILANKWAGYLHLLSFVARLALGLAFEQSAYRARFSTDFFGRNNGTISPVLKFSSSFALFFLIVPFTAITAAFHLTIAYVPAVLRFYLRRLFFHQESPLRWIEYAITAGFMTVVLAFLNGATNSLLLFNLVAANAMMNLCGWLHERLNNRAQLEKNNGRVDWLAFWIGCISFIAIWITFSVYFVATATIDASRVPWFVWGVNPGIFILFALFPLNMIGHYSQRIPWLASTYRYELGYIVLSFTSKQFLAWFIFIGTLTAD